MSRSQYDLAAHKFLASMRRGEECVEALPSLDGSLLA
jgi:hypothetical protein